MIKRDRGINCTAAVLVRWSMQFGTNIQEYQNDPELLWNADESMIDLCSRSQKFIIRPDSPRVLQLLAETKPHITVACCFNAVGHSLPPFVILNGLKSLPPELAQLQAGQQILLASQKKDGWIIISLCNGPDISVKACSSTEKHSHHQKEGKKSYSF